MSAEPDLSAGTRRAGPVPTEAAQPRVERDSARPRVERDAAPPALSNGHARHDGDVPGCTAAQLRRFIKSRAYVPMHELRRRFELNGEADDVSPVETAQGLIYLGLPMRESRLIGELVRQGEIGVELCRDPRVPIAVGVYPMRPITRQ